MSFLKLNCAGVYISSQVNTTEIVGDKNGGKGILLPFYLALGVMARKLQAITYSFKNKGAKNYLKPTPLHNYQRPL